MPGSVTIGHTEAVATVEHADAQRLAVLLDEMGHLLAMAGPNRLTEAQVAALCEGRAVSRDELARWCRGLAAHLHEYEH
ncbi:hypothetical protein OG455_08415 [Kitasatospora sp. NBC_01287]|uniref:hypothetical protein n=1 Tax=Kitasatospora sp. NBC_01287 TaxID=2903573 RepID=UPI00224FE4C5|nr:hypothetical protein [Kitasatospora sp. NBC_01287]MCX4745545.1 hypothetical protein [Kitasatospora sp. NBC_01287]